MLTPDSESRVLALWHVNLVCNTKLLGCQGNNCCRVVSVFGRVVLFGIFRRFFWKICHIFCCRVSWWNSASWWFLFVCCWVWNSFLAGFIRRKARVLAYFGVGCHWIGDCKSSRINTALIQQPETHDQRQCRPWNSVSTSISEIRRKLKTALFAISFPADWPWYNIAL